MRNKDIVINGQQITIREKKIKVLKNDTMEKLPKAFEAIQAASMGAELVDALQVQIKEFFPELKDIDLEDCYPSEIEEFLEAWSDVNFTGLKRLFGPLMSLVTLGQPKPESGSGSALGNLITGKSSLFQN